MSKAKILIVDDDAKIRALVIELLARHGMAADGAGNVADAQRCLEQARYDLLVLDVMMPGETGTSFCSRLRQTSRIPILMLSALGDDVDRIVGLEVGADDYLPKPFNPRELIARINSLLRRSPPMLPGETHQRAKRYAFAGYVLDPETRSLTGEAGQIALTSGEFSLLLYLVERAPRVLSRDQLLDFSRGAAANPFDRSIDTQISRLRRKLESDPKQPGLIKTVRNLGYAFAAKVTEIRD